jgi:hypothetical protein
MFVDARDGFREALTPSCDRLPDGLLGCLTGKSVTRAVTCMSSPFCKNILIFRRPNQRYISRRPVPLRGAARDVTDAGRDAVDADGAPDEGA